MGALQAMLGGELGKLESDVKSAYGYIQANWKRFVGYYVAYFVATHWGPAASEKAQAILKILGF